VQRGTVKSNPLLSQELFLNLAEELKMPLMQIARVSELASQQSVSDSKIAMNIASQTADATLQLLDNYILGIRLSLEPQNFNLESVSVSSVLYDASQRLNALAKSYGVEIDISIGGRFTPVSANRQGLEAALVSLGAALIEALPALEVSDLRLQLATHQSRYGIVAGVYADTDKLSLNNLNIGRNLQNKSKQPFVGLSHTSGAGIFIADTILKAMNLNLMTSRHHNLYGIGTVLIPNKQLQLV
jgi:hypothetical protein